MEVKTIELSIRALVEFAGRSGDIDNRSVHSDPDAMQEGARLHRKIQKEQGAGYSSEITLKYEAEEEYDGERMLFFLEGRADGIYEASINEELLKYGNLAVILKMRDDADNANVTDADEEPAELGERLVNREDGLVSSEEKPVKREDESVSREGKPVNLVKAPMLSEKTLSIIDEIKTTYRNVENISEPVKVHLAQAMCYAFIYSEQEEKDMIDVRMTYCNLENEKKRYFYLEYTREELRRWFSSIIHEYAKWVAWQIKWERQRNATIKAVDFPLTYRPGQLDLVKNVYVTIKRKKKLFLEAPTGVGKTLSTVFPSVKAMGEGLISKIFYGTAKTIVRTVAEEAFSLLMEKGMSLKVVTITAKEKICVLEKPECNPDACPRAKGHFDRVNDCVYDMLQTEGRITRELILAYAEKYNVCPFEMCLDVTLWADAVICDYNYLFDPNVYLKRFFADAFEKDYVFLIDEAHNLVERAREMYSAYLVKEDFLAVKKMVGSSDYQHKRLSGAIDKCNREMLDIKRQSEGFTVWEDAEDLYNSLLQFMSTYESMPVSFKVDDPELLSTLYLDVRHFVNMYNKMEGNYSIYSEFIENGGFCLTLKCMDPSKPLKECLDRGKSAVFFSATLLPVKYYKSQLGGAEDDYAVYAPSPFDTRNRLIMIARDVSTKYTRRGKEEYIRIARYIKDFSDAKKGNYMVFFPSYRMMEDIAIEFEQIRSEDMRILLQSPGMDERERDNFLAAFDAESRETLVGFCVMGGIFGEGIDLRAERLIGAVIVGTGLPQVCDERELFRAYFDEQNGNGFEYAYLYNGMNKVLQSAGRVIRTAEDRGAILLLDERFGTEQYRSLFPQEWYPYSFVNSRDMASVLKDFWEGKT